MKLKLLEKRPDDSDITTFIFQPEGPLDFKPGQFLRYHLNEQNPDDRGENRFFSIASAPFEGVIRVTTRFASKDGSTFKRDLGQLNIGDEIEAFGPSGSFTIDDPNKKYVFIAGGIGVTPFRSILLDLDYQGKPLNITLLYANRTSKALFKQEFEALASKHPEFKLYYFISEEAISESQNNNVFVIPGKIDSVAIKKTVPDLANSIFYISGPEPMVMSFEEILKQMGVPKENTKRDYFPGYQNF